MSTQQEAQLFNDNLINLRFLNIVLTQKCNLNCPHCMRGDATSKSMTVEVMDSFFQHFSRIEEICLSGGEISLEPKLIFNLLECLKKYNVDVQSVIFPTNALVVSNELLEALAALRDYLFECADRYRIHVDKENCLRINISYDHFHIEQMQKQGYDFEQYRANIQKYVQAFGSDCVMANVGSDYRLIGSGRARSLGAERKIKFNEGYDYLYYVRTKFNRQEVLLGTILSLSVNGDIIPANCAFKDEQKYSIGNILKDNFGQIMSRAKLVKCDSEYDLRYKFRELEKSIYGNSLNDPEYKKFRQQKELEFSKLKSE